MLTPLWWAFRALGAALLALALVAWWLGPTDDEMYVVGVQAIGFWLMLSWPMRVWRRPRRPSLVVAEDVAAAAEADRIQTVAAALIVFAALAGAALKVWGGG